MRTALSQPLCCYLAKYKKKYWNEIHCTVCDHARGIGSDTHSCHMTREMIYSLSHS